MPVINTNTMRAEMICATDVASLLYYVKHGPISHLTEDNIGEEIP